jgi:heme oxygenase (mycobilin-producing)
VLAYPEVMSVVKINAIAVPDGAGPELEARFAARLGAVEGAPGFEEFCLLRPTAGENRYFVYTRWATEQAFADWSATRSQEAHAGSRQGGPPVATGAALLEFEVVSRTVAETAPYDSSVSDYLVDIEFNDDTEDQIIPLPGLDREQAERFAGELRYEVMQAREVEAPIAQVTMPDGTDLTVEPLRIVAIDLREVE